MVVGARRAVLPVHYFYIIKLVAACQANSAIQKTHSVSNTFMTELTRPAMSGAGHKRGRACQDYSRARRRSSKLPPAGSQAVGKALVLSRSCRDMGSRVRTSTS